MYLERLRNLIAIFVAPMAFLSFYLLTEVIGNLIYASPVGAGLVKAAGYSTEIFDFPTSFTLGYWVLLLMPFVVTPVAVLIVRKYAAKHVKRFVENCPEFGRGEYLTLVSVCVATVAFQFWDSGALASIAEAKDPIASIESRFFVLSAVGFPTRVVLQSLLGFLATYAVVKAIRSGETFWRITAVADIALVSVFLVMLNMKWPVLVFYLGIVFAIFMYSQSWPYTKTIAGALVLCAVYAGISTWVYRGGESGTQVVDGRIVRVEPKVKPLSGPTNAPTTTEKAKQIATVVAFNAFNRMAIAYPYYYNVFTTGGQVCGGIIEQAHPGPVCRPSTLIYERVFGEDGFEGRGTSPAAVQISGYAIGGWPVAVFALLAASVVLGLFASLPLDGAPIVSTFAVLGGVTGYHFSQLPGEGPIFYDHGIFYSIAMVMLFVGYRAMRRALFAPSQNIATTT